MKSGSLTVAGPLEFDAETVRALRKRGLFDESGDARDVAKRLTDLGGLAEFLTGETRWPVHGIAHKTLREDILEGRPGAWVGGISREEVRAVVEASLAHRNLGDDVYLVQEVASWVLGEEMYQKWKDYLGHVPPGVLAGWLEAGASLSDVEAAGHVLPGRIWPGPTTTDEAIVIANAVAREPDKSVSLALSSENSEWTRAVWGAAAAAMETFGVWAAAAVVGARPDDSFWHQRASDLPVERIPVPAPRPGQGLDGYEKALEGWSRVQPLTEDEFHVALATLAGSAQGPEERSFSPTVEMTPGTVEMMLGAEIGCPGARLEGKVPVELAVGAIDSASDDAVRQVEGLWSLIRATEPEELNADEEEVLAGAIVRLHRRALSLDVVEFQPIEWLDEDYKWDRALAARLHEAEIEYLRTVDIPTLAECPRARRIIRRTEHFDVLVPRILLSPDVEAAREIAAPMLRYLRGDSVERGAVEGVGPGHLGPLVVLALGDAYIEVHRGLSTCDWDWVRDYLLPGWLTMEPDNKHLWPRSNSPDIFEPSMRRGLIRGEALQQCLDMPWGPVISWRTKALRRILQEAFGDSLEQWELASSLLGDWDDSVPELIQTVKALAAS